MKKKKIVILLVGFMALLVTACGKAASKVETQVQQEVEKAEKEEMNLSSKTEPEKKSDNVFSLKPSLDKYTQYVDKYIGMNAASVGYTSLGGDRMVKIGAGLLKIIYVSPDGTYVGVADEEALKNYVVVGQSIEPNTEVKLTFEKDSEGKEYDNLVDAQTYEKIDLAVIPVGSNEESAQLVTIAPSPDKYTRMIANYVGKNLSTVGYISLLGDYRDTYGAGNVELNIMAEDGGFVEISDEAVLRQYMVTGQNIAPNTEMKLTFRVDSNGKEYSNLVDTQSFDSITLNVKKIADAPVATSGDKKTEEKKEEVQERRPENTAENQQSNTGNKGNYEAIYNNYSSKMKNRSAEMIADYNSKSNDMNPGEKVETSSNNLQILVELYSKGVEEMADYMLHGGDASGYSEWTGKLYDVYAEEYEKIMDAYTNSF